MPFICRYSIRKRSQKCENFDRWDGKVLCYGVVLLWCCVTADDDTKCNPVVIFKRTTIPMGNFSKNIIVKANLIGWVTKDMFLEWLNLVWRKRKGMIFCIESSLIYGSASSHLTEDVKKLIKTYSKSAVIPGDLTKFAQPLDLTANRTFKSKIRNCCE